MSQGDAFDTGPSELSFQPPVFEDAADERKHRDQRRAAAFRHFVEEQPDLLA